MIREYEVKIGFLDEESGKIEILIKIDFDLSKEAIKEFIKDYLNDIAKHNWNFKEDIKSEIEQRLIKLVEDRYEDVKGLVRGIAWDSIDIIKAKYVYWDGNVLKVIFLESPTDIRNSFIFLDAYMKVLKLKHSLVEVLLTLLWEEIAENVKIDAKKYFNFVVFGDHYD